VELETWIKEDGRGAVSSLIEAVELVAGGGPIGGVGSDERTVLLFDVDLLF
jgi:hypothetical protein